mmetsp:Transcript_88308/g.201951  ORF Transcript_88308/g.201951 Transcript_88308/m.201951 type:complete len:80 (-) Transcript_88308:47-286(-)
MLKIMQQRVTVLAWKEIVQAAGPLSSAFSTAITPQPEEASSGWHCQILFLENASDGAWSELWGEYQWLLFFVFCFCLVH